MRQKRRVHVLPWWLSSVREHLPTVPAMIVAIAIYNTLRSLRAKSGVLCRLYHKHAVLELLHFCGNCTYIMFSLFFYFSH